MSPGDYPDGLDVLLDGMAAVPSHRDHCHACRDARTATERELRELQDAAADLIVTSMGTDPPPPVRAALGQIRQALPAEFLRGRVQARYPEGNHEHRR